MSPISRRDVLKAGAAATMTPGGWPCWTQPRAAADPYADAVLVDGEPPLPEQGGFTVAVLPDTQNYSERYPADLPGADAVDRRQPEAAQHRRVLHLGDITNNNAPAEWENALAAMRVLDGKLPYAMVPGNHDYSAGGGCSDRTTLLNDYFPVGASTAAHPRLAAPTTRSPSGWRTATTCFRPRGATSWCLPWNSGRVATWCAGPTKWRRKHKDRAAILITHAYMYYDDTRYDWKKYGDKQTWNPHDYKVARATPDDVTDGEELWNELVSQHENFVLTLNGHVLRDGLGRTVTATPGGRDVHQVLVNFQMRPKGGDGWLRLLEFRPDGRTVQIYDYSPTRKQRNESPQNQFAMKLAGVGAA